MKRSLRLTIQKKLLEESGRVGNWIKPAIKIKARRILCGCRVILFPPFLPSSTARQAEIPMSKVQQRKCTVRFTDRRGVERSTLVKAASTYEAVCRAWAIFKQRSDTEEELIQSEGIHCGDGGRAEKICGQSGQAAWVAVTRKAWARRESEEKVVKEVAGCLV
jgi:hypothetical protein